MSSLVLPCARCGRQTETSELREGRCRRCRIEIATEADRAELERLLGKQRRYSGRAVPTPALERQLDRVRRRLVDRVREVLPPGEPVEPAVAELLEPPTKTARRTPGGLVLP
ncbi:MAG: hypothetical protein E6J14_00940 [Chloroflexi bacterium]|nr:MAG: hypothetical protein E6J14_00940 [Chloroflexota bacterium]